jgi:hypothetical protein
MEDEKDKNKLGVTFKNNIFYAGGQGRFRTVYTHGSSIDRQFNDTLILGPDADGPIYENNCFYGPWLNGLPEDPAKIVGDPKFLEPGSGGVGLSTLEGYKLMAGSPCLGAGEFTGIKCEMDFYGNSLDENNIDIGVHQKN